MDKDNFCLHTEDKVALEAQLSTNNPLCLGPNDKVAQRVNQIQKKFIENKLSKVSEITLSDIALAAAHKIKIDVNL